MLPSELPVRFSHLKQMARSPAHYLQSLMVGKEDTPQLRFGRLTHARCLGGKVVVYDGERRGNAWKDFAAAHEGEEIVTRAEYDRAERIAEVVRAHPIAGPLLVGRTEHHVAWENMGRKCSSRLDALQHRVLTDLKTTTNAEPGWFSRYAIRIGYHAQGAWYQDACEYAGHPVDEVYLVAVETTPPHPVTVLRLTPRALFEGRKLCRLWMERLLVCEASNEWPAYVQSIVDLDVGEPLSLLVDGEEVAA